METRGGSGKHSSRKTVNDSIVGDGPSGGPCSGALPALVACYERMHFPHSSVIWKRVDVLGRE